MSKRIAVRVTEAQLRCLNSALARYELEAEVDENGLIEESIALIHRTRQAVWNAMKGGQ